MYECIVGVVVRFCIGCERKFHSGEALQEMTTDNQTSLSTSLVATASTSSVSTSVAHQPIRKAVSFSSTETPIAKRRKSDKI